MVFSGVGEITNVWRVQEPPYYQCIEGLLTSAKMYFLPVTCRMQRMLPELLGYRPLIRNALFKFGQLPVAGCCQMHWDAAGCWQRLGHYPAASRGSGNISICLATSHVVGNCRFFTGYSGNHAVLTSGCRNVYIAWNLH